MEPSDPEVLALYREIQQLQMTGSIAELSLKYDTIQLRTVGTLDRLTELRKAYPGVRVDEKKPKKQAYYFLADDLRPGSGVIRFFGGRPEGPEGTLTCLLSSKDGRKNYFAAAGHVLSNFWNSKDKPDHGYKLKRSPTSSIYRHRKGFPATNSRHFLGKLRFLSEAPKPINAIPGDGGSKVDKDIGIVEILGDIGDFLLKQRTTCYGSFGEWPCEPDSYVQKNQTVMKCGAEETHWTYAVVEDPCKEVTVYGPDGLLYVLSDQVILTTKRDPLSADTTAPPRNGSAQPSRAYKTPFAVPGDSGTMVVDRESKRPVGMLIAGSVLDGLYVMTPIRRLWEFWTRKEIDLILLRA